MGVRIGGWDVQLFPTPNIKHKIVQGDTNITNIENWFSAIYQQNVVIVEDIYQKVSKITGILSTIVLKIFD